MMKKDTLTIRSDSGERFSIDCYQVHTLVIGSGAAGLNGAVQLNSNGVEDVLIVTEGLQMGTSINAGSDKQTYYKLGMCGSEPDSIESVAEALYHGGGMHGDLALVEASLSPRAFMNLVNLGVAFPRDAFGQFPGYKTDHDPRQRATSAGPYTSREMCRSLIREVKRRRIPVRENRLAVSLLTIETESETRVAGAMVLNDETDEKDPGKVSSIFEVYVSENVVFATGGPGGLYKTSVYPEVHTGGIGLAFLAGASGQNLPEFQYGLSSIGYRWNVSGSYMQVIPSFISKGPGAGESESEFLKAYFPSPGEMNSAVFLKGYQWPFDSKKIVGGSSLVDILVYLETVVKKRRVFLDYRSDPEGFSVQNLSGEARDYLARSGALQSSPFKRLQAMNPEAAELYRQNNIDLSAEPLEIAICAQHNNGGLAANLWWESVNIKHLFPVGEVNGSHGISRPGGTALNSGQVGGLRAAEYIANCYRGATLNMTSVRREAAASVATLLSWMRKCKSAPFSWSAEIDAFQSRMTDSGAHIRSLDRLDKAVRDARAQWHRLETRGCAFNGLDGLKKAFTIRQLCYAHVVYLDAMRFAVESGTGSRGSAMVLDPEGTPAHPSLGLEWNFVPENSDFRTKVLETHIAKGGEIRHTWVPCRPLPKTDSWFETAWAAFKKGEIYR
jgi:succinate dehydrogenase/fumarate reductase flavoprotein subunit